VQRSSGILLHISSLPGAYGIGDFGKGAYDFIDFLASAGQSYWQILPLGLTGEGDSPYQSFSAFAGNPYFIDLEDLVIKGFLKRKDIKKAGFASDKEPVDYLKLYQAKMLLLKKAYIRSKETLSYAIRDFAEKEAYWLDDFALFMALKEFHKGKMWRYWDEAYKWRDVKAIDVFKKEHKDALGFWYFTQYLFFAQWFKLKLAAHQKEIKIIGDLPIYVAEDSADVWSHPSYYHLSAMGAPTVVSGCPPDAFSDTGQLWGNPIYNWEKMKANHYDWWVKRFKNSFEVFDMVRIDHFRGFQSYWQIPFGEKTAVNGKWLKGPGESFFKAIEAMLGGKKLPIIAEDLGILTQEVITMRRNLGYPGMKILQFAFDTENESTYLPHYYTAEDVVYTGTHDNHTIMGWYQQAGKKERAYAKAYLKLERSSGYHWGFIEGLMRSAAGLVIIPMQDILGQDDQARMNFPSTVGNNWRYRITERALSRKKAKKLYCMTRLFSRLSQ